MTRFTRRQFNGLLGTVVAASSYSLPEFGNATSYAHKPKVVVIGGGAGGAAAVHYLAKDSNGLIDITLIEPAKRYYSGLTSNHYLGGLHKVDSLGHDYQGFASDPRVNIVRDWVASVDKKKQTVTLASGASISYDRLIVSPGIDIKYDSIDGYSIEAQAKMPHGLKSAAQVQLIKRQITDMRQGGTFIMVAPASFDGFPHNLYERISMIAHYFTKYNARAKIVILGANNEYSNLQLFRDGWDRHYSGMIDWISPKDHGGINNVNPEDFEINTDTGVFKADAALVIPAQKAGMIAMLAGLTRGDWVPIKPSSMATKADPNIYVIGDAAFASSMPKTAYSAASQAKVAANAICGELIGSQILDAGFTNITWSTISNNDAVKFETSYKAGAEKIMVVKQRASHKNESANIRKATFQESKSWNKRFA